MVKVVDFDHFRCKIELLFFTNLTKNPLVHKTRAQELTSGAICMFLSFYDKILKYLKDRRVKEKKRLPLTTFFRPAISRLYWQKHADCTTG